jgi:uncharacterized protein DUF3576
MLEENFKGLPVMLSGMSNKLVLLLVSATLFGCGGFNSGNSSGSFGGGSSASSSGSSAGSSGGKTNTTATKVNDPSKYETPGNAKEKQQALAPGLDLQNILNPPNDNSDIRVNKYLWAATLDTLNFLPIEAADPFSGVVVMGWGRAPGSSTDFRATVLIQDPALEAGSLKVAMQRRNGPASAETNRQIEDAILTRARQLRIQGAKRR